MAASKGTKLICTCGNHSVVGLFPNERLAKLWDTRTGKLANTFNCSMGSQAAGCTACTSITGRGLHAFLPGAKDAVLVWDIRKNTPLETLETEASSVHEIKLDSDTLAATAYGKCVCVWNATTFKVEQRFETERQYIPSSLSIGCKGKVVCCQDQSDVRVWRLKS